MMKDPVCGMEIQKEKTPYSIQFKHETFYFCSEQCKVSFAKQAGPQKPPAKKGFLGRFLEKLAKQNEKNYGGKPPTCH